MNPYRPVAPQKSLGQNFLANDRVAQRIVDACSVRPEETVLEIGPGKGAITQYLVERTRHVIAVEKDRRLADQLKTQWRGTGLKVIAGDFLRYSFAQLPDRIKVVGNLPYYVVTPIVEKLLKNHAKISQIFMTVQLEYGQRIAAKHNTKNYGSFSCFVQYYAIPKILFKIKSASFHPAPKVQSCFMQLDIRDTPEKPAHNEDRLFHIIQSCFTQRRKTVQNSLATSLPKAMIPALLESLKIDPRSRAENLSLSDYIRIANATEDIEGNGR